jgi:hypothetical protein
MVMPKCLNASVCLAVLLASVCAYSQQTNVGNITGTVVDTTGAVIPEADVVALNVGTNVTYSGATTSGGVYFINLLPVGRYTVSVTKNGFKKATAADVAVLAGQTTTSDVTLQIGTTSQTIEVTGTTTAVNTTDTNQGTTRSLQEFNSCRSAWRATQLARRSVRFRPCRV